MTDFLSLLEKPRDPEEPKDPEMEAVPLVDRLKHAILLSPWHVLGPERDRRG